MNFRMDPNLEKNMVKDDKGDLLAELHTTLIGGRITSVRFLNQ
jgi:hypothetical protein